MKTRLQTLARTNLPSDRGKRRGIPKWSAIFLVLALIGVAFVLLRATLRTKAPVPKPKIHLELDFKALVDPLQNLTPAEREVVDKTIKLIEQKQHVLALANLSALTASNPMNSALRVLRAYVLLELGNKIGAVDDARIAESSGLRSAYRCWFLAQVAYLAGNKPLCRREIKHLAGLPSYRSKAEQLRRDLESRSK
jgi:hypothetical protein